MSESLKYTAIASGVSVAESLGITEEEIKNIVYRFYERVRDDDMLGPVFAEEMKEDWDSHLEKMCRFWTTIMFGKELYHGNPLIAHAAVSQISKEHFSRWLSLFEQTLQEVCPQSSHVHAFIGKANNMAFAMTRALGLVR